MCPPEACELWRAFLPPWIPYVCVSFLFSLDKRLGRLHLVERDCLASHKCKLILDALRIELLPTVQSQSFSSFRRDRALSACSALNVFFGGSLELDALNLDD